jgi:hypothetical protein
MRQVRLIYTNFEFKGPHFAFADGTWAIADRYHFRLGECDKADVSGAKTVNLDALIGLPADDGPSRFQDFSGPRPIGDNEWRAAAILLKENPGKLAGIPPTGRGHRQRDGPRQRL